MSQIPPLCPIDTYPRSRFPIPETQTPPPQATFTHLPPDVLPALAREANTTPDALSKLTVSKRSDLYQAVTEYVALAAPQIPIFCDSKELSSSSSSDDEVRTPIRRFRNSYGVKTNPKKKKHPAVPKFCLALGIAQVNWPPPPELRADALAKMKGKRPCNQANSCREDVSKEEGSREQFTIYIAHYTVGMPDPLHNCAFRELLLATTEDISLLRKFATDVCVWHFEKEGEKPERVNRFILFRYRPSYNEWYSEGWKRTRPVNSVVLPDNMMQEILGDVEDFLKPGTKEWYINHGLPPRRCYLFYGRPGTGKTSTIRVIASKFKLSCCFLSMTSGRFSNESLADALCSLPDRALIVIEDVDSLFNRDRRNAYGGDLSFSGLLNALDGLVSADGVITVLTANKISELDKALIRGGRVDRRFLFDYPTDSQIRRLFLSFYPDAESEVVEKFMHSVLQQGEGEARMISTLQQLFIRMRERSAEECAAGVSEFYEKHLPREVDERAFIYS